MTTRVGVAGWSHLGIVSSVAAAAKGCEVVAYDPQIDLTDGLSIAEPGLAELFAAHRARLKSSTDPHALRACEVLLCAADVPTDQDSRSDLSVIHRLLETLVSHAAPGACVVILSQVPPGFTRAFERRVQPSHADRGLHLYYQVETLVIGQAVKRALTPERIIVGCDDPRQPLPPAYARFLSRFKCPILPMRYESAELAKIAVNMFLASSVCTTNTLAELCEAIGADWSEIVPALRSDKRIGAHAYVAPGLGLSGGNLERDLITFTNLAGSSGTPKGVVEAWLADSRHQKMWVTRVLETEVLSKRDRPVIGVWGLAYKPGTSSMKNAASLTLLQALSGITIRVYDPQARLDASALHDGAISQVSSPLDACHEADALVIMTPWPALASVDLTQVRGRMRGDVLIDPSGLLSAHGATAEFRYVRRGRRPSPCGERDAAAPLMAKAAQ